MKNEAMLATVLDFGHRISMHGLIRLTPRKLKLTSTFADAANAQVAAVEGWAPFQAAKMQAAEEALKEAKTFTASKNEELQHASEAGPELSISRFSRFSQRFR